MASNLPPGVVQGPDGKFQSADSVAAQYEDLEYATFQCDVEVATGDYTAGSDTEGFNNISVIEGEILLDIDDIVDRHEIAHLVSLEASLAAYANGSSISGPSDHFVSAEMSASPSVSIVHGVGAGGVADDITTKQGDITGVETDVVLDDSSDLVARPLTATASAGIEDEANNPGVGSSRTTDRVVGPPAGEWDFDRRDELFLHWVVGQDGDGAAPFGGTMAGQMVFGIAED